VLLRTVVLTLLALLLLAAPAAAAPSPSVRLDGTGSAPGGGGRDPSVLFDVAGVTRVAWINSGGPDPVRYCIIDYGASGCRASSPQPLVPPAATGVGNFVELLQTGPNTVTIVVARIDGKEYASSSTADGAWSAWGAPVGSLDFLGSPDATFTTGPSTGLSFFAGRTFQASNQPFGGAPGTPPVDLDPGFGPLDSAMVVQQSGPAVGHPVVVMTDTTTGHAAFRRYVGGSTSTASLNTLGNWGAATALGAVGDETRLASGPSGTFLLMNADVGDGFPNQMQIRHFNGVGFDPPVNIGPRGVGYEADLFEASNGVLYATWRRNGVGTPTDPTALVLAKSSDGGATWSVGDISRDPDGINDMLATDVGAAADGRGAAAFESAPTDPSNNEIRLSRLDVLGPLSTSGGGGSAGGSATPGGGLTPGPGPSAGPGPTAGPGPAANKVAQSVTVGGLKIDFLTPSQCVPAGQNANLAVTSKDKKRLAKGHKGAVTAVARGRARRAKVKIKRVTFFLDSAKLIDKKAAFKASFPTTGMAAGSRHTARAVVVMKKARKKKPFTKTMTGSISIC
jgi:hypothetical protein